MNEDADDVYSLVLLANALLYLCETVKRYSDCANCYGLYTDFLAGKISVKDFVTAISVGNFKKIADFIYDSSDG